VASDILSLSRSFGMVESWSGAGTKQLLYQIVIADVSDRT
jgi:hypothetical protein